MRAVWLVAPPWLFERVAAILVLCRRDVKAFLLCTAKAHRASAAGRTPAADGTVRKKAAFFWYFARPMPS